MSEKKGLIIVGAGGHAKVVISTALATSKKIYGFLDDNPALQGKTLSGYPILGGTDLLHAHDVTSGIFGLGSNAKRKYVVHSERAFDRWETLIHPTAFIHPSATIGKGTVIFAGAIIQPDVKIGEHCIINTGATIDHDCIIGDYVHLAPGVHLAGGVRIGEGSFLGIASAVVQEIKIGDWVTVAAGGIVVNDIAAQKTVMGIPAKERAK